MKKITLLNFLLTISIGFSAFAQTTVYVSATGGGDGTSESSPLGNFGNAMNQITSEGDRLIIIGTISPNGQNLNSKSFGFTIEGLNTNSVLSLTSSSRLFTINGATSANVTFKNLTFLNNNTTLAGGSVFFNNAAGATATFENCTFTGNSVTNNAGGGAIWFANGTLNITNSTFDSNSSSDEAGAIFGQSGTITITNSTFDTNSSPTKGGAIFNANANLTIIDSSFENNTATTNGGAIVAGNTGDLAVSGSLFDGNSAAKGGAIAVLASGADLVLDTSTFVNNTVSSNGGGALYLAGTNANSSITNTTIFNNSVTFTSLNQSTGGGIRIEGARPFTITNSLIYGNFVSDGSETSPSDIGGPPAVELTLINSLTQKIEPVLVQVGDPDGNDVFSTSITDAALSASNLTFNATSGNVEYDSVDISLDSPIDFGTDGNDAGSWDSGLTFLSLKDLLKLNITVYADNDSKTIEINHDLNQSLSVTLFNILGSSVMDVKNVSQTATLNVNHLKTGVYILIGKSSGKYFSKKLLLY